MRGAPLAPTVIPAKAGTHCPEGVVAGDAVRTTALQRRTPLWKMGPGLRRDDNVVAAGLVGR